MYSSPTSTGIIFQGLPFFDSIYRHGRDVCLHSAITTKELRAILEGQMKSPYFPVELPEPPGLSYSQLGESHQIGSTTIVPFPLNHPGPTSGFRFETPCGTVVHASDREHGDPEDDRRIRAVAREADVLIYDAQYDPLEYDSHRGWGHSTWLEATRVARDAGVKQLVLFHHEPGHDDASMDEIVDRAREEFPNTIAARESLPLELTAPHFAEKTASP